MPDDSAEITARTINETIVDGWARAMGVTFVRASAEEVVAELEIGPAHLQPYGIVHGGVHCGLIETLASVGAALSAMPRGQSVVGLENHTTFLRAARSGTLTARAVPLVAGHRTQVWEGSVVDSAGRVLATGRVRILCLDPGSALAGQSAGSPGSGSKA